MTTVDELRQTLPYPHTYTPKVAAHAALSLTREPGVGVALALKPFLLCQDWDKRVVIHWRDTDKGRTMAITRILEDSEERFSFHADEQEPATYVLTPLTLECFASHFRDGYERQGNVPDFRNEAALSAWLLRR